MAEYTDPLRQIFLAGVGALAIGAEKSQEIIGQLVEKGKITVDEGKEMASEVSSQASESLEQVRNDIIEAHMKGMTKEERDAFAARVAEMAASMDGDDALRAKEAAEVEVIAGSQGAK